MSRMRAMETPSSGNSGTQGVRLLVGTDAGTPLNFHTDATWQEMDLMVRFGVPPMEVLVTATRRNAEYLGRGKRDSAA